MNQGFGIEVPRQHEKAPHRPPARYLVVIDAGGGATAKLFLESRELVGEYDAGTEEAASMTRGLAPTRDASGREWDRALEGHSVAERRTAAVFTLDR